MENINKNMKNLEINDCDDMDIIIDKNESVSGMDIIDKNESVNGIDIIKENNSVDSMDIIEKNESSENKSVVTNDNTEKKWDALVQFVNCLKENYGDKYYEIKLYNLLLDNTGVVHKEQRDKHISIFEEYILENKMAILNQDVSKLKENFKIVYSEKIFIDIKSIITGATKEDQDVIWEHLLVLLALSNDNTAQNILTKRNVSSYPRNCISEDNIFNNLFKSVTSQLEQGNMNELNPMEMVGNIMNSGVINELFNSFAAPNGDQNANPEFDFSKIMGSFQEIMTNLNNQQSSPNSSNNNP